MMLRAALENVRMLGMAGTVGLAMAGGVPGGAGGQEPVRGEVHLHGGLAVPVGEFRDHVDLGGGGGIAGLMFLDRRGYAGLRLDGSFVVYGHESQRTPLSPTVPFVDVDVETTNAILSMGLGPQVYVGNGPIRPYVHATVGFAYFVTSTSVRGTHDDEAFASTTNFDDFSLALSAGGGLSVSLSEGDNPISLNLAAHYQRNGLTDYLTGGTDNLEQLTGGRWRANPVSSDANLMTYRVGVAIGIR